MIGQWLKSTDEFKENFRMKIKDETQFLTTWTGVVLTYILWAVLAIFLYAKIVAWDERKDVDIMGALVENAVHYTTKFNTEQGFFVAAALSEYGASGDIIEVPELYGELAIEHYGWGYDGELRSRETALDYHYCSDEELGLARGPETTIYPFF